MPPNMKKGWFWSFPATRGTAAGAGQPATWGNVAVLDMTNTSWICNTCSENLELQLHEGKEAHSS